MKRTLLLSFILSLLTTLEAGYNAPQPQTSFDSLRLRIQNQESEIRTFEQKLESVDAILETLQSQLKEQSSQTKELIKSNNLTTDEKTAAIEGAVKTLTADIKQLHTHANDTVATLTAFKQRLQELDQKISTQSKNMESLQSALQSVLDALQVKSDLPTASSSERTYKIKAGDSLEKIARLHNTSVSALKELNNISSDKIVVGKTLKIPD